MNDFSEQGSEAPLTMNPFFSMLLQQFLSYIVSHADEIVEALMDLLGDETTPEDNAALESFRSDPSQETLNAAVQQVSKNPG